MSRTSLLRRLARSIRIAHDCERAGIPTREGLDLAAALAGGRVVRRLSRREFLLGATGLTAIAGLASTRRPGRALAAPPPEPSVDVGIVGAGLAGLACAYELRRRGGITATLYEAADRVGGRCFSLGGAFPGPVEFPGQVVERGGEFIDNLHKTMLGYAREFGLTTEDLSKEPGEVFYYLGGQHVSEALVVDEYRALVPTMRDDLNALSNGPTADAHTPADVVLDRTNLREYLATRGAGDIIRAVIDVAYTIEYGLDIEEQSSLNFLFFIHADRRSKFRPFGVFSDERYHVVGGNQQIPEALRERLGGQIHLGLTLVRARRTAAGRVELVFMQGRRTVTATHDAVILATPFSVLREVELDPSLGLPQWKLDAIRGLRYGTNAKMMVGFDGRPWADLGGNGTSFSDLPNLQNTWETNPSGASALHGVLTDYSGGRRGATLDPRKVQREAGRLLGDLERVYPGSQARATRDAKGKILAHLESWPSNPLTLGSYTCNHPGYFTTIAGREAVPVGNLFFAGEHTDSFYEWQGFMEGAANSGIRAGAEVLAALKTGAL